MSCWVGSHGRAACWAGGATSQPLTTCTSISIRPAPRCPIASYPFPSVSAPSTLVIIYAGSVTAPLSIAGAGHRHDRREPLVVQHPSRSRIVPCRRRCHRRCRRRSSGGPFRHFPWTPSWHRGIPGQAWPVAKRSKQVFSNNEGDRRDAGGMEGMEREGGGGRDGPGRSVRRARDGSLSLIGTAGPSQPHSIVLSSHFRSCHTCPHLGRALTPSQAGTLLCIGRVGVLLGGKSRTCGLLGGWGYLTAPYHLY